MPAGGQQKPAQLAGLPNPQSPTPPTLSYPSLVSVGEKAAVGEMVCVRKTGKEREEQKANLISSSLQPPPPPLLSEEQEERTLEAQLRTL
jgi:hypothetical protein